MTISENQIGNNSVTIQLFNAQGQMVKSFDESAFKGRLEKKISLESSFSSGIYFVQIICGEKVSTTKLIVATED